MGYSQLAGADGVDGRRLAGKYIVPPGGEGVGGGLEPCFRHALCPNMSSMNAAAIRELLDRKPFEPFEVHMTSGEVFRVSHPEQVFHAGARLLIYYPEADRLVWCSLLHVSNVVLQQSAA